MNHNELSSADERLPRQRILVVDDDAAMRRLNTEVLLCYGYAVDTAENGEAAWDALQLTTYDLLLTDNGMPKMTGVELLRKLHGSGLELPTIMATGTTPQAELSQAPCLQPAIILLKPYGFEDLVSAVRDVLHDVTCAHGGIATSSNWQGRPHVRTMQF